MIHQISARIAFSHGPHLKRMHSSVFLTPLFDSEMIIYLNSNTVKIFLLFWRYFYIDESKLLL